MSDTLVKLINDKTPWAEWPASAKAAFAVLFYPLIDYRFYPEHRGECRLLAVHLFRNFQRKPPKFIVESLEILPKMAINTLYRNGHPVRSVLLESCAPRPYKWPSIS